MWVGSWNGLLWKIGVKHRGYWSLWDNRVLELIDMEGGAFSISH